jgi:DNA mismatch repair protein MutS
VGLRTNVFPEIFRTRLENIGRMLSHLEVEKYYNIGRGRGFSISEIARLIQTLEEKIGNGEMDAFWKDFFLFEAYYSLSKGIEINNFVFPVFCDNRLSIDEFYHPLLKHPVRNNLEVKDAVTLITGPNMSGKSTLLKSVGLCVYLAHLGLGVPAVRCELPFFDVISIAINLNDDIKSGYSHFMKEIQTLKQVVVEAHNHKRCFAIFDELFRGTNIEDALAISKTTILGLTAFSGSFFFISTHLHQLEKIADSQVINTCYIDCQLENGMPVFTYKLKSGWSDLKIGQIIFRQEGLDELLA